MNAMTRPRRLIVIALVCMVVPLLYAVTTFATRPEPTPWLAPAKPNTTCILPTERMRYQHMTYLKHLRDEVVREGRRDRVGQGMSSCRNCHAEREQFCDRCHARASVSPDCFGCHRY
jgi:hypothetical protein